MRYITLSVRRYCKYNLYMVPGFKIVNQAFTENAVIESQDHLIKKYQVSIIERSKLKFDIIFCRIEKKKTFLKRTRMHRAFC